jgi:hypothetical protein
MDSTAIIWKEEVSMDMPEAKLEVICHTQEDQRKLARDGIIPGYVSEDVHNRIISEKWTSGFEVFIPRRNQKWARENKYFPVVYL